MDDGQETGDSGGVDWRHVAYVSFQVAQLLFAGGLVVISIYPDLPEKLVWRARLAYNRRWHDRRQRARRMRQLQEDVRDGLYLDDMGAENAGSTSEGD